MKLYPHVALMAALAVPAFCQEPAAAALKAQARAMAQATEAQDLSAEKMAELHEKLAEQRAKFHEMDMLSADKMAAVQEKLAEVAQRFDTETMAEIESRTAAAAEEALELRFNIPLKANSIDFSPFDNFNMAFLQEGKPFPAPVNVPPTAPMAQIGRIMSLSKGDGEYDRGTQALDQHRYDEAIIHFDQIINAKSSRADGALYWKAYALNRAGKRDDALTALATLRRDYASSAWLNDAQALEAEIKQNSGQPVLPNQESNDDLKLLAINSLMNGDAERAIPLIEGILKGNSPPKIKRNALFVLTQSKSPRAQQVLSDYAKGGGNPDLQLQAIQYLGQSGTRDVQQQLSGIYGTVNDTRVKSMIIDSLASSRAYDSLLNLAKTEKDANLRNKAIRALAGNRNAPLDGLLELYPSADAAGKSAILDGLRSRRDAKTMIDLARKETDPAVKRRIVERLGDMHENKDAMDYMMELLKQ